MGFIYLRTNKINGKQYVGQAVDIDKRQRDWNCLLCRYAGSAINNARNKYGIDAFEFEILKECKDDELNKWEMYYIKELNTKRPYGYNLTDGGDGTSGFSHTEETKKKLSELHKGKHHSEEAKNKISKALKNRKRKPHSEETKKKLSEANKGKHLTEEARKKMSEARKGEKHWFYGKHWSEEARKKLSDSHKGKKHSEEWKKKISNAHKGKKHSEESKKKMTELQKNNSKKSKPVLQINKYTNEIVAEFPSTMEVQRQLSFKNANISKCCNGKRKTCGGFIWRYK